MSTKQIYKNKVPSLNYKTFSGFPSLEKTAADLDISNEEDFCRQLYNFFTVI